MRIRVEVKNKILGNSVFWEGEAERVGEIRNIPAREIAKLVAEDGQARTSGMWHVCALSAAGAPVAAPTAASPGERLAEFLNASRIRPPSEGTGQG